MLMGAYYQREYVRFASIFGGVRGLMSEVWPKPKDNNLISRQEKTAKTVKIFLAGIKLPMTREIHIDHLKLLSFL